jgi:hypothetical protein
MSEALLENHGSYKTLTRFGGRKLYVPDPKEPRPKTIDEKCALIRKVYQWNDWEKPEHKAFCELENLPLRAINDYSESELDRFLEIFEKGRMLLLKD